MKIVQVTSSYYPSIGGIETFCRELSMRTARLGHEVHIITLSPAAHNLKDDKGVVVHRLNPVIKVYKCMFSPLIRKLVGEIGPEIVHIQAPAPLLQEFCLENGRKYIATYHSDLALTDEISYRILVLLYKRMIFPQFCKRIDRVISPTISFQQNCEFLKLVPNDKKRVIPNGVDTSRFKPPPKSKLKYREELGLHAKYVGLFVGSMEKWHAYKRVDILLEALSKIRDIDLEFLLVGEGELRSKYEEIARKFHCEKKVKFLGKVDGDKLIECYWASDFLVLASRLESFSMVVVEAMACGIPVITTDTAGPSEIVEDGISGIKVKVGAPEEISNAIKKLMLLDEDRLRQMSLNARKFAVERYDWSRVVQAYMQEYESLLAEDSPL